MVSDEYKLVPGSKFKYHITHPLGVNQKACNKT